MDETRLNAAYGLYEQLLADIPHGVLEAAALAHIASSRYFPVVAELRAHAVTIQTPPRVSGLEAWSDSDDSIACKVRSMLPDYTDRGITLKEQSVIKALFTKTYEQIVDRERQELQLLPQVRDMRDRLARQAREIAAQTRLSGDQGDQARPRPKPAPLEPEIQGLPNDIHSMADVIRSLQERLFSHG